MRPVDTVLSLETGSGPTETWVNSFLHPVLATRSANPPPCLKVGYDLTKQKRFSTLISMLFHSSNQLLTNLNSISVITKLIKKHFLRASYELTNILSLQGTSRTRLLQAFNFKCLLLLILRWIGSCLFQTVISISNAYFLMQHKTIILKEIIENESKLPTPTAINCRINGLKLLSSHSHELSEISHHLG
jgi:hypothetical protein